MASIKLKDLTNEQILEMVDNSAPYVLLPNFMPISEQTWWTTDVPLRKEKLSKVEVRDMVLDLLTDISTLKKILNEVSFNQLLIYQFTKKPPANLKPEYLSDQSRENILIQNGMINRIWINYEFVEFSSVKHEHGNAIKEKYKGYLVH